MEKGCSRAGNDNDEEASNPSLNPTVDTMERFILKNVLCRSSKLRSNQSSRVVPVLMVLILELVTSVSKTGVYLRVMGCIGLVGMFNQSTGAVKGQWPDFDCLSR